MKFRDAQLAYLLLRVYVGVNLAMHGVTRLLSGTGAFVEGMVRAFATTPLPAPLVHALAYFVLLVRRSDDVLSVDSLRGSRAPD
jgi:uncharacterized membrane protein YphA (DoxX/SURF4 family)